MNNINFALLFSHSAGEFADEEFSSIIKQIAAHEGKTESQVIEEILEMVEERIVVGSHPFQTWVSPELMARIKASK